MSFYLGHRGAIFQPLIGFSRQMSGLVLTVETVAIAGCTNLLTNDYQATAVTTHVWQVKSIEYQSPVS